VIRVLFWCNAWCAAINAALCVVNLALGNVGAAAIGGCTAVFNAMVCGHLREVE
jgi:O-antigen/teichoic acid export membrane protein